jgi:hypothetical protein
MEGTPIGRPWRPRTRRQRRHHEEDEGWLWTRQYNPICIFSTPVKGYVSYLHILYTGKGICVELKHTGTIRDRMNRKSDEWAYMCGRRRQSPVLTSCWNHGEISGPSLISKKRGPSQLPAGHVHNNRSIKSY